MLDAKHINEVIASRRALLGGLAGLPLLNLAGCATSPTQAATNLPAGEAPGFASVAATNADTITLPPGYRWQTLLSWGDSLFDSASARFDPDALTRADQEQRFGQNNDMLALFPATYAFPWPADQRALLLCANHEYFDPALAYPGLASPSGFTAAHWASLYACMGVSVVQVEQGDVWRVSKDAAPGRGRNRRITPFTPVVFSGPAAQHRWISAAAAVVNAAEPGLAHEPKPADAVACGTLANCAGGRTPWGTYLTSEENFDSYFRLSNAVAPAIVAAQADAAWIWDSGRFGYPLFAPVVGAATAPAQFDCSDNPYGPSLYGWVVEIDPYDPSWAPRKRTGLGRKKGECATTAIAKDGRVAVYMGDDQIDHFVFKFVSDRQFDAADRLANRDLLDQGKLYAARFNEDGSGDWLELSVEACNRAVAEAPYHQPFADAGDVVIRAREAAVLLGATPMDRPEDVEAPVDAEWRGYGVALVVCTYNRNEEFHRPGNPRRGAAQSDHTQQQANVGGHILRIDEANADHAATRFAWDVFALCGDPDAAPSFSLPGGVAADISVDVAGRPTISGERFTCPDNICFDSGMNVWIATDGSPAVLPDCNNSVLIAPVNGAGPRPVKRFLVGPVGAEICGPTISLDQRAFLCSIQHPGESDVHGTPVAELRWRRGARPPSNFPDGGNAWPRSSVVVVTREDGGPIGG